MLAEILSAKLVINFNSTPATPHKPGKLSEIAKAIINVKFSIH